MIDTANIMTVAATDLKTISIILDKKFKGWGKTKVSNDDTEASLNLSGHWINNIRLKSKGFDLKETVIYVDFSYPKYFTDNNIQLISTEKQRETVNKELLRLIKEFSADKTLMMRHLHYIRVDVAQQFEDIFEDYYQIFALVYQTFVESMGAENKKSKKYTQIEKNSKDYTTGFTYTHSEYKINIYNKTAQSNKKAYVPGRKSIIRVEQVFTPKVLKKKFSKINKTPMKLSEYTMKKLEQEYSKFLEEKLWDRINLVLENKNLELKKRLMEVLKKAKPPLRAEIKDMQSLILDFEMIKNIIKNSDIGVTDRMKYNYIKWARESLEDTEANGSTKIKFFDNFSRLEKLLYNITSIETKIEFIQETPKIDSFKNNRI